MDVVLPGEADAAVQLERLTTDAGERVVDVRPGGGDRLGRVVQAITEGQGGIVRRRPHGLELQEQVGQPVLDRLKTSDGPAELHPLLQIVHRGFEQDVRRADGLG